MQAWIPERAGIRCEEGRRVCCKLELQGLANIYSWNKREKMSCRLGCLG